VVASEVEGAVEGVVVLEVAEEVSLYFLCASVLYKLGNIAPMCACNNFYVFTSGLCRLLVESNWTLISLSLSLSLSLSVLILIIDSINIHPRAKSLTIYRPKKRK
jgi:hypothetical protein